MDMDLRLEQPAQREISGLQQRIEHDCELLSLIDKWSEGQGTPETVLLAFPQALSRLLDGRLALFPVQHQSFAFTVLEGPEAVMTQSNVPP